MALRFRDLIRRAFTAGNTTCANGHMSVIMLPDGRFRCMDCGAQW